MNSRDGAQLADRIVDARGKQIAAVDLRQYETEPADAHRVISAAGIIDRVTERKALGVHGAKLPWSTAEAIIRFAPGQVTVWAGDQSAGKSTLLSYCTLGWVEQNQLCLVTTLEEPLSEYGLRFCRQATGAQWPADEEIAHVLEAAGDRLYLWDVEGRIAPKRMVAVLRYAATKLQIQHFILDNWTKTVPPGNDNTDLQWNTFASILQIARDTGVHVHIVMHLSKEGRTDEIPTARHIRGTSTIADQADQICLLWRNEKKERANAGEERIADEERAQLLVQPDVVLISAKTKFQGYRARVGLWFEAKAKQYTHGNGRFPIRSSLLNYSGASAQLLAPLESASGSGDGSTSSLDANPAST